MSLGAIGVLFGYTFLATVALAVVPHEPMVIWAGSTYGIWPTAAVATLATVASSWVDFIAFGPLMRRMAHHAILTHGAVGWMRRHFRRAPFGMLAVSAVTPLPAWPFKAIAFAERYPLGPYLLATAVGRLPRYLLLAWLGVAVQIPTWVLVLLFVVLIVPSVRTAWKQRNGN